MSNFKYKLAKFMYGRYGNDELYNALCLSEFILLFLGAVCNVLGRVSVALSIVGAVLLLLALALLVWTVFRCFSRNIAARQHENQVWLRIRDKVRKPFRKKNRPTLPPDTDTHVFRACPHCAAVLRLPREKGVHKVKCPRCGTSFGVKVK